MARPSKGECLLLPPVRGASAPTGASITTHRRQGRGKGYGDESARKRLSGTLGTRAITLFQQTHYLVKRLTNLHTNSSSDYYLVSGRKANHGYYYVSAKPPLLRFDGLVGKNHTRGRMGCLLHPHFGGTSHTPRQRAHDRKSGPMGTERSRSGAPERSRRGLQKKGVVKEQGFLV